MRGGCETRMGMYALEIDYSVSTIIGSGKRRQCVFRSHRQKSIGGVWLLDNEVRSKEEQGGILHPVSLPRSIGVPGRPRSDPA